MNKYEVTRTDFTAYDSVKQAGKIDMFNVKELAKATGLPSIKLFVLMKHYEALKVNIPLLK